MQRERGTVKTWERSKNFGFISRDDGQADVTIHCNQLREANLKTLMPGDVVEFDLLETAGGRTAAHRVSIGLKEQPQLRQRLHPIPS